MSGASEGANGEVSGPVLKYSEVILPTLPLRDSETAVIYGAMVVVEIAIPMVVMECEAVVVVVEVTMCIKRVVATWLWSLSHDCLLLLFLLKLVIVR